MNKQIKIFNTILIYISIIFFLIVLYKNNYLQIPIFYSYFYLIISIVFVFLGQIGNGIAWYRILSIASFPIDFQTAIVSEGITIFGKYVPGKIWMIVGRASYISGASSRPIIQVSSVSLFAQMLSIWLGMLIGGIGLFLFKVSKNIMLIMLLVFFIITSIIYIEPRIRFLKLILPKKIYQHYQLKNLTLNQIIKLLPAFFLPWLFYCIGFFFLVKSLVNESVSLIVIFIFPLAIVMGIITIFAPGGLGVREGLITGCLVMLGTNIQDSTTIAFASRLWFLIGELFIFILAFVTQKIKKNNSASIDVELNNDCLSPDFSNK